MAAIYDSEEEELTAKRRRLKLPAVPVVSESFPESLGLTSPDVDNLLATPFETQGAKNADDSHTSEHHDTSDDSSTDDESDDTVIYDLKEDATPYKPASSQYKSASVPSPDDSTLCDSSSDRDSVSTNYTWPKNEYDVNSDHVNEGDDDGMEKEDEKDEDDEEEVDEEEEEDEDTNDEECKGHTRTSSKFRPKNIFVEVSAKEHHNESETEICAESKHSLQKLLNNLFTKDVQLNRTDSAETTNLVLNGVERILECINRKDSRFGTKLLKLGSFWPGLKVEEPNEYDIGVCVKDLGTFGWVDGDHFSACGPPWTIASEKSLTNPNILDKEKRFYGFNKNVHRYQNLPSRYEECGDHIKKHKNMSYSQLASIPTGLEVMEHETPLLKPPIGHVFVNIQEMEDERWKDWVRQNDVVPILALQRFRVLLDETIKELQGSLDGRWELSEHIHGPSLKVNIILERIEVSVDLVLTIQTHVPFPKWIHWPRRNTRWPKSDKINKILRAGISVVPKLDFYWSLSFAEVEKMLIKGESGDKKKIHRITKKLNTDYWSRSTLKEGEEPVITSYMLKNIWFYEMEHFPDLDDWTQDQMSARLLSMTDHLHKCLCQRKLLLYFNPMENLLAGTDPAALDNASQSIHNFLNDPEGYITGYYST